MGVPSCCPSASRCPGQASGGGAGALPHLTALETCVNKGCLCKGPGPPAAVVLSGDRGCQMFPGHEPLLCAVRPPDSSTHSASFAGELHPLVSSPRPGLGSCPSWAWVPQPALCPSCMVPNSAWPDGNTASCSPWPHASMPTSGFLVAWVCVAVCTN